jgi:hypothetical protein
MIDHNDLIFAVNDFQDLTINLHWLAGLRTAEQFVPNCMGNCGTGNGVYPKGMLREEEVEKLGESRAITEAIPCFAGD